MPGLIGVLVALGTTAGLAGVSTALYGAGIIGFFTSWGILAGVTALEYFTGPRLAPGDLIRTIRSTTEPARWILGRARVGGLLVYYKETGATIPHGVSRAGRELHMALVLAEGPC